MDDIPNLSDTPEGRAFRAVVNIYIWRELPKTATGEDPEIVAFSGELFAKLSSYVN